MADITVKKGSRLALFLSGKIKALRETLDETAKGIKNVRSKRIAVITLSCVMITAVVVCYFTVGKKIVLFIEDRQAFNAWIDSFGVWGRVVFITLRAVQTVVKIIPGEPLEIAAGYMYGVWGGLFYCLFGQIIGSVIIILLTKKFGMKLVELFVPKKKIDSLAFLRNKKNLNITLFIIYLIPSTPKDVITYLMALTDENMLLFMIITTIGRIPSVITSTWCGSALESENYMLALLVFVGTAVCGLCGAAVYSKISAKKSAQS